MEKKEYIIAKTIEFNGDYGHSIKIIEDQYYHLMKSQMCLEAGFKLLQIKEREWYDNKELIKSRLKESIENHHFKTNEEIHILDLSWYDDRFKQSNNWGLIGMNPPKLIQVGQYLQWDSGEEIYKKI